MIEFYERYKKSFESQGVNVDRGVVMSGCFRSNKPTLQRTMIPEVDSNFSKHPTMELIKEKEYARKSMIRKLQIRELVERKIDDMSYSYFNMSTYSGLMYDEYFNYKTKSDAFSIAA